MDFEDFLIFFLTTSTLAAVVFLALRYFRLRQRQMIHLERMAAIDKGLFKPDMGDDDMTDSTRSEATRTDSMRWFRLVALGLGFLFLFGGAGVVAGLASVDHEDLQSLSTLGLIPLMAGFGLMLFSFLSYKLEK